MFAESCTGAQRCTCVILRTPDWSTLAEFVQLISSEASELSDKEKKTTIMPEHVLAALESLGFGEFSADLQRALEAWKAEDKAATSSRSKLKGKGGGMSEEEAVAAQQALFAAARARVWGGAEAGAPP